MIGGGLSQHTMEVLIYGGVGLAILLFILAAINALIWWWTGWKDPWDTGEEKDHHKGDEK